MGSRSVHSAVISEAAVNGKFNFPPRGLPCSRRPLQGIFNPFSLALADGPRPRLRFSPERDNASKNKEKEKEKME
jgi:hypothetical protein